MKTWGGLGETPDSANQGSSWGKGADEFVKSIQEAAATRKMISLAEAEKAGREKAKKNSKD